MWKRLLALLKKNERTADLHFWLVETNVIALTGYFTFQEIINSQKFYQSLTTDSDMAHRCLSLSFNKVVKIRRANNTEGLNLKEIRWIFFL